MKNSIKWISTSNNTLPILATDDKWSHDNGLSCRVIVSTYNRQGEQEPVRFARYHHPGKFWNIEGVTGGQYTITHFAYLNLPTKY